MNSTARLCQCSKVTVLRLLADAGTLCAQWHNRLVRNLQAERIQCDEAWAFVGGKDRAKAAGAAVHGSIWTWIALDADSKLVISYAIGDRGQEAASAFMQDLRGRLANRVQISTDGHAVYERAIVDAFGWQVDFAKIIKVYGNPREAEARYSPGVCIGCEKERVIGWPVEEDISTSHVERQNLSLRMGSRRYTRLTNAFSKNVANHQHAVNLHYWAYNWSRRHQTLKTTPAVAAGIATRKMSMVELVEHIEAQEKAKGGRLTDYLPSPSK